MLLYNYKVGGSAGEIVEIDKVGRLLETLGFLLNDLNQYPYK